MERYLNQLNNENIDEFWDKYVMSKEQLIKENNKKIQLIGDTIKDKENTLSYIKQLFKDEGDKVIKESLQFKENILVEEIKILNTSKKTIAKMNNEFYGTKEELQLSFNKLFKEDFKDLSNERKRILIDKLIDKVVVTKKINSNNNTTDNLNGNKINISLDIYVKVKFDILM